MIYRSIVLSVDMTNTNDVEGVVSEPVILCYCASVDDLTDMAYFDIQKVRHGMVAVTDGKGKRQAVRLQLAGSHLTIQKEELVYAIPTEIRDNTPRDSKERDVSLKRGINGELGLSIKGGAEHNLPILISKIYKDSGAAKCGKLHVGDAITKINGHYIENCTHDAAVELLRRAGNQIMLTVRHYKVAAPFLATKPDTPPHSYCNEGSCFDSGSKSKCSSHSCKQLMPKLEKHWTDIINIHLLMAYVTRYVMGTDKLRPDAFEVLAMNCQSSGVVHCDDVSVLSDWVKHIANNITAANIQHIKMLNRALPPGEQLWYMGWVCERLPSAKHWQSWIWRPMFIVLKGQDVCFLDNPPLHREDWLDCDPSYRIYDTILCITKESEYVDNKQHCFTVKTVNGEFRYFCSETGTDLLRLENSWYKCLYQAVEQIKSKTFSCTYRGKASGLTIDMENGFSLFDIETKQYMWRYKFSHLRGSSDDGKSKVKLMLQEGQLVESREIECETLQMLLFCMNAFLTAKLVSVDPAFLKSS